MQTNTTSVTLQRTWADKIAAVLGFILFCAMGLFLIFAPYVNKTDLANRTIVPIFGVCFLVFAAMWLQNLTDFVKVDGEGIHHREKLHQHSVRWTEIGACFLGDYNLIVFDHTQNAMLMQISIKTQPEKGGWSARSRKEFNEFLKAKMAEYKIEKLQMTPAGRNQVTFQPRGKR
jgi:hypothetical protein